MSIDPGTSPTQSDASVRTALITGAAGFIGSALCRELRAGGWSVLALDDLSSGWLERLDEGPALEFARGDVRDTSILEPLLARADLVVHLAARVGVRRILAAPAACARENVQGVEALLAAASALPAQRRPRILCASSSEVYADSASPLSEGAALREFAADGRYAYAASKRRGEELLDASGLWPRERAPVHLRFFNVVGPGQDASSGMVLPRFLEQAARHEPLQVFGDGRQLRTFAHVDDVACILAGLCERACAQDAAGTLPGGALNVGGRAVADVETLARLVLEVSGSRGGLRHVDPRDEFGREFREVRARRADLARLEASCGPIRARSLEAIVRDAWARHVARSSLSWSRRCASLAS